MVLKPKIKLVTGEKSARVAKEMDWLIDEIEPGTFKQYANESIKYGPKPGKFSNNRTFVAHYEIKEPMKLKEFQLVGPALGFWNSRDDRENRDDESTKHINTDYRFLVKTSEDSILQCSFTRYIDHFLPVRVEGSTASICIDKKLGVDGLPMEGPTTELTDRGLPFGLDDFVSVLDRDESE